MSSADDDAERRKREAAHHEAALQAQMPEAQTPAKLTLETLRAKQAETPEAGQGQHQPPPERDPAGLAVAQKAEADKAAADRAAELMRVNASTQRDGMAKDQNQLARQTADHDRATKEHLARQREDTQRNERLAAAPREHDAPAVRLADLQRADNAKAVEQQIKDNQRDKDAAKAAEQAKAVQAAALAKRRETQTPEAQGRYRQMVQDDAQRTRETVERTQAAALQRRRDLQAAAPASAKELTDRRQVLAQRQAERATAPREQTDAQQRRATTAAEKTKQKEGQERG